MSGQEFPHSPSQHSLILQPQLLLPLHHQPQPRLHLLYPSGSSSEGGAVACKTVKHISLGGWQEGVFYFFGRHVYFLGWTPLRDHPPPKPPFRCPHPNKKGTNLPHFQIGIHLHTHQDLRLKCCRNMGQKLRYGRPCTRDLPGTHNWLAQSHIASISSEFH
jgi:hypothetical protein